jgi:hypothetical protein
MSKTIKATKEGNLKKLEKLIETGGDLNFKNDKGNTKL